MLRYINKSTMFRSVIFFLLPLIPIMVGCAGNSGRIPILEVKNPKIYSLIDSEEERKGHVLDFEQNLILLQVEKTGDKYKLRIAFMETRLASHFLEQTHKKVNGYFVHNDRDVLVFGSLSNDFFSETDQGIVLKYLDKENKLSSDQLFTLVIEPFVAVYEFNNNNFNLIDSGLLPILN